MHIYYFILKSQKKTIKVFDMLVELLITSKKIVETSNKMEKVPDYSPTSIVYANYPSLRKAIETFFSFSYYKEGLK